MHSNYAQHSVCVLVIGRVPMRIPLLQEPSFTSFHAWKIAPLMVGGWIAKVICAYAIGAMNLCNVRKRIKNVSISIPESNHIFPDAKYAEL